MFVKIRDGMKCAGVQGYVNECVNKNIFLKNFLNIYIDIICLCFSFHGSINRTSVGTRVNVCETTVANHGLYLFDPEITRRGFVRDAHTLFARTRNIRWHVDGWCCFL